MNYILRKLQGDITPILTLSQIQTALAQQEENDRVLRAIFNAQNDDNAIVNNNMLENQSDTLFGKQIMSQIQSSLPSIKTCSIEDEELFQQMDLTLFNQVQTEEEMLKASLQHAYRLYKASNRTNQDGLIQITNYQQQLSQNEEIIESKLAKNCVIHAQQFSQGLDKIDEISIISGLLCTQLAQARSILQQNKQNQLSKQIVIVEKYKTIQKIKFTLEKLKILKETFGQLAQQMQFDSDAYQVIPVMKDTQNKINKYKLNELHLSCISENFFENKIESLKERIKEGIYANLIKFNEEKYYQLLKSYFYIEKHYQMPQFVACTWGLIKKSIKLSFSFGISKFKEESQIDEITTAKDDLFVIFIRILYGEIIDQLLNFHLCNRFHQNQEFQIEDGQDQQEFEEYAEIIRQTYLEARSLIWTKIQKQLIKLLKQLEINIITLSIEHIMTFMGYCCLLIKRAEDFSQGDSHELCSHLSKIYSRYVSEFHNANEKAICTYLSNELYQRLPLQRDQKLKQQFQIIDGLKHINKKVYSYLGPIREENYSPEKKHSNLNEMMQNDEEILQFYLFDYQNPFKLGGDDFQLINKALWNSHIGQSLEEGQSTTEIVLTSTSIRIFEQLSSYVTFSYYYEEQSQEVAQMCLQLLELCMYISFTQLVGNTQVHQLLENYQQIIKFDENKEIEFYQIQYDQYSDCLIAQERFPLLKKFIEKFGKEHFIFKDLDIFQNRERKPFVDITERAVAVESILYLLQQMKQAYSMIGIDTSNQYFDDVFTQYKEYLYRSYMQNFIKIDGIVQMIPQIKWDIRELHSENQIIYIDRLVQFIIDQKEKLKSKGGGVIPLNAQKDIFNYLAEFCLSIVFEYFGKVKKLSTVGRDQMISEFTMICKSIDNFMKQPIFRPKFVQKCINYLKIFNALNYEEVDQYIGSSKTQIPHRLLLNLLTNCPSYNNLKRQQKREVLVKFYKEYYETFKLF